MNCVIFVAITVVKCIIVSVLYFKLLFSYYSAIQPQVRKLTSVIRSALNAWLDTQCTAFSANYICKWNESQSIRIYCSHSPGLSPPC